MALRDARSSGRPFRNAAKVFAVALFLLVTLSTAASAKLFLIAHRGGRTGPAPENTIANFQNAIALGIHISETDVWPSSDGVPVIHHDRSMCRTTNIGDLPGFDCAVAANNPLGRFPEIEDFTLAFLKTLDAGSWWDPVYAGTTLPTLEEALLAIEDQGMPLLVEMKTGGMALSIKQFMEANSIDPSNLIVWARSGEVLAQQFRTIYPESRRIFGVLAPSEVTEALLADISSKGDFGIAIKTQNLTQQLVDLVHSYGLFLYGTATSTGSLDAFQQIDMGVDGYDTKDAAKWVANYADLHCADGFDNDSDGLIDSDGYDVEFDGVLEYQLDPGCDRRTDPSEHPGCSDGLDNDEDGSTDWPADPGCQDADQQIEDPECEDGIDNDSDTLIDLADPSCTAAWVASEGAPPQCSDGIDNDGDALIDFGIGGGNDPGCQNALQDFEDPECDDGVDNDGDTLVDLADPSCMLQSWVDDERSECNDGVDNDGDLLIDFGADPGCVDAADLSETGDLDSDSDGVADVLDNCTLVANPMQLDGDGDFCGNLCDADYDQDGISGLTDFAVIRGAFGTSTGEPGFDPGADHNGDGVVGVPDFGSYRELFSTVPGPSGTTPGSVACP